MGDFYCYVMSADVKLSSTTDKYMKNKIAELLSFIHTSLIGKFATVARVYIFECRACILGFEVFADVCSSSWFVSLVV